MTETADDAGAAIPPSRVRLRGFKIWSSAPDDPRLRRPTDVLLLAVTLLCLLVYLFYRNSARLAQLIGATGTAIVVRLSAFLLFAIGIQVLWNGLADLLREIIR